MFPALIQDCNRADAFLYDNADTYGLDRTRFAVMGFSAGGHLALLMGLSKNENVPGFHRQSKLLHAWLTTVGVPNELVIVNDAPHFGPIYDADEIRSKVLGFLKSHLIEERK